MAKPQDKNVDNNLNPIPETKRVLGTRPGTHEVGTRYRLQVRKMPTRPPFVLSRLKHLLV